MEMKDGRELAIKMLYPGIEDLMQQDNSAMDWLGSTFEHFKNGFQTEAYADKFKQDLALELDYKREAVRQNEFYPYFLSEPNIIIPKVDQELSGDRHLVMQWEDSEPLEDFCQSQSRDHKIQAIQLWAKFLLDSAFLHGVLYTDPNPGNFGFRIRQQNVQLVVYDYGSTS
jgi:predicted unusual protein kinase regulating ubiquinone biosynthesis (AarF/ABC1/UbiB family)